MPTHNDDLSSGAGAQNNPPGVSFLVFLETKQAYTQQAKRMSPERNDKAKRRGEVRTDAHIRPRRRAFPIRCKLEHLRLDRVRRVLIFLPFAFPTL